MSVSPRGGRAGPAEDDQVIVGATDVPRQHGIADEVLDESNGRPEGVVVGGGAILARRCGPRNGAEPAQGASRHW